MFSAVRPLSTTRCSTLRYNKVVKDFNSIQRGYIIKYGFEHLLNIPEHLNIPLELTQWIIDHITGGRCFKHKSKTIRFNKEMVNIIFGFSSGTIPFVFESDDPEVVAEVQEIRKKYLDVDGKLPIKKLVSVMLADDSEGGFIRSFVLFFISIILCPLTYNFVNPKYLFTLNDVSSIPNLDFGSLCIDHLFTEIDKFHDKVFDVDTVAEYNRSLWIGGFLPVLSVSRLIFLLHLHHKHFCLHPPH